MKNLALASQLVCLAPFSAGLALATSPQGVDSHTVALWLFDETSYPNCILTDASRHEHDLRLTSPYTEWWEETEGETGAPPSDPLHVAGEYGLIAGRFGNALYTPAGSPAKVVWARRSQRYGEQVYLSDAGNEVSERLNLGHLDFTIELWFRAVGRQSSAGRIFQVSNDEHRRSAKMVNGLLIDRGRSRFVLRSRTFTREEFDLELSIPTDSERLDDERWHHLAFTFTAAEQQIRHYVDGVLQPLPPRGGFLPTQNQLEYLWICDGVNGVIDEYRISDIVRYKGSFDPPGSFSRNYGEPRRVNEPSGPPLLFGAQAEEHGPIPLLSRKHVFIDAALIDEMRGVELRCHPPVKVETSFRNTKPWEPGPAAGSAIPHVISAWDADGSIHMLYDNRGMWGARHHALCYATSADGLVWEKPTLNLKSWCGDTDNNIVLRNACQGSLLIDGNPNGLAEEKYKFVAWNMYWGFYAFVSEDGVHWKRNEVGLLPMDPDGGCSAFWDDQSGIYRVFVRAKFDRLDPFSPIETGTYRALARIDVPEIMEPWPFVKDERPNLEFKLAKPVRGELPIIDTAGQVYRFRAHKYPWAPDTYVAFPWRYLKEGNVRPGTFLMVSRDGVTWTRYDSPYYLASGWKLDGLAVREAVVHNGLIRRGDEILQFGTVRFTTHNGVLYGGDQGDGSSNDRLLLLKQRLDGFVSLSAGDIPGGVVTKPILAADGPLVLNVDAEDGSVRVALLDETGTPLEGCGLEDCDVIEEDNVRQVVTWRGGRSWPRTAGRAVRIQFDLRNARLYAMQFAEPEEL